MYGKIIKYYDFDIEICDSPQTLEAKMTDQAAKEQLIENLYNERTELAGAYTEAVQSGRIEDADDAQAEIDRLGAKLRELGEDL
ncbi:hypothetical protein [Nonomuraea helvata]|uniref:PCRF domain-containing protein n=1 Tax=Nonomuraea helvata TaxID=37484 RepID=A0ABV5SI22_9ACTN